MKKFLALLLSMLLLLGLVACGGGTGEEKPTEPKAEETKAEAEATPDETKAEEGEKTEGSKLAADTLVVASQDFSGIFSQFFYQTNYDANIIDMTSASLINFDPKLNPTNEGLSDFYPPEIIKNDAGEVEKVVYKFILKDGVCFSDGEPITTEDIAFTVKVMLDPNFNSKLVTFNTVPLVGANEYRYDDADYAAKIEAMHAEAAAFEPSDDEIKAFAEKTAPEWGVEVADLQKDGQYYESDTLPTMRDEKYAELEAAYIKANLEDGEMNVPEVEGMKIISDKEIHFELNRVDPTAIYQLNIAPAPKHYYCPDFQKGMAPEVEKKNGEPMGAGPYKFVEFKDGIVSMVANEKFYRGAPKIKNLKFQEVAAANHLQVVASNEVDISEPSAKPEMMADAKTYDNVTVELVDNNGYGYIGCNSKNVPDKLVRQGIFYLMDRAPAVQAYYGDLASVIERPISKTSWAFPEEAKEYYGFSPEKALAKFKEAGYEQVDGKLVRAGEQLKITIGIPGDGVGDHPAYPIVNGIKTEGEKLGMAVEIRDLKGGAFWTALDGQEFDLWTAAWGNASDPDMYQVYHSNGPSNKGKYNLNNPELDKLIEEGRSILDNAQRKAIYAKAYDIVMEEAVEMPTYQRKNMFVFNNKHFDLETLPEELTPYSSYLRYPERLELLAE